MTTKGLASKGNEATLLTDPVVVLVPMEREGQNVTKLQDGRKKTKVRSYHLHLREYPFPGSINKQGIADDMNTLTLQSHRKCKV